VEDQLVPSRLARAVILHERNARSSERQHAMKSCDRFSNVVSLWGVSIRLGVLALMVVELVGCREATEVDLEISTNAPCANVSGTTISTGTIGELEGIPPRTSTFNCDAATGRIGSITIVPRDSKDVEFGIRVVTGLGKNPNQCVGDGYTGGCIVARRVVAFVPHQRIVLPVRMEIDCRDVHCGVIETCRRGVCVGAKVPDPIVCSDPAGCGNAPSSPLPDASAEGGTGGAMGTGGTGGATASGGAGGATGSGGTGGATGSGGTGGFGGATGSGGSGGTGGSDGSTGPSVLFADDFTRPDNATVGNGWVETESAAGQVEIFGNKLRINGNNGTRDPIASHSFVQPSSGVLTWKFDMDWTRVTETNYSLAMQLGSGMLATSDTTGVAIDLWWGNFSTQQAFGYKDSSDTFTNIMGASAALAGAHTIEVIADLAAKTFSVKVDNVVKVKGVAFRNAVIPNQVRFYGNSLTAAEHNGRTFDNISITLQQ
jgi:hypothetical protein